MLKYVFLSHKNSITRRLYDMPATPRRGGATYKYLKRFCEGTPGRQIRDKEELKMKKG